jgi:hypothetical protein
MRCGRSDCKAHDNATHKNPTILLLQRCQSKLQSSSDREAAYSLPRGEDYVRRFPFLVNYTQARALGSTRTSRTVIGSPRPTVPTKNERKSHRYCVGRSSTVLALQSSRVLHKRTFFFCNNNISQKRNKVHESGFTLPAFANQPTNLAADSLEIFPRVSPFLT